jgi:hypothetical protein
MFRLFYIKLKLITLGIVIFLAFSLNSCGTDGESTIKQSLYQIKQEALSNKKSLDSSSIQIQSKIAKLDTLILLLNLNKDYQKACNMLLDLLNVGVGPYMENLAIKNVIKTDNIKLIKDFEKKESLEDLYECYKSLRDFEIMYKNYFYNNYSVYLKNNLDLVCNKTENNSLFQNEHITSKLEFYKRVCENRLQNYQYCIIKIENFLFYADK